MKDNRIFGYCKTCNYYIAEGLEKKKYCNHPLLTTDDPFVFGALEMSETDYCSRFDDTED